MEKVQKYHKAQIRLISKKTFWNTYDNLGRLLLMNFMTVVLSLTIIGIPFAAIGLFAASRKMVSYEEVEMKDFWRHWQPFWKRGVALAAILIFVFILMLVNLRFYLDMLGSAGASGAASAVLSLIFGLVIWLFIFFCMLLPYVFPVLIAIDATIKTTLRNSFFLMLDNLKVSIYLLINCLAWLSLGLFTGGLLALFLSLSAIAVMSSTALREVLKQYEQSEPDEEEEVRGFRDLIKPWG
ncbi:DUF624 domain-containing protein [candidate division KSB1 bacterium]|nr:DUF624 domain-containing protein [candidate division KSB1 bacterium]